MKIYNKLVRDNIPNIIKESGLSYDIKILNDDYRDQQYQGCCSIPKNSRQY